MNENLTRRKMGKPPHKPTPAKRELVRNLARLGTPHPQIAKRLGLGSVNTLKKHYPEELEYGLLDANANVAGALYTKAMSGDTGAMCFWMKTRAGWREKDRDEPDAGEAARTIATFVQQMVAVTDAGS